MELSKIERETLERVMIHARVLDFNAYERLHKRGLVEEVHDPKKPDEFELRVTEAGRAAMTPAHPATPGEKE